MEGSEDSDEMKKDIEEMQRMLEGYLAFARGDAGEPAIAIDMRDFLDDIRADAERNGTTVSVDFAGDPVVRVRPDAFKRCISNLTANAIRHAKTVTIEGLREGRFLTINVDDDGPGIPAGSRDDVFRPFVRLDQSRNQDEGGTGLGLSIARDIARSHGGEILLGDSPAGGLRASVRIPV
jgi:two-component system osmolarity sensor histidine kinase EnvZ